jgi:hypothetical protein
VDVLASYPDITLIEGAPSFPTILEVGVKPYAYHKLIIAAGLPLGAAHSWVGRHLILTSTLR